MPVLNIEIESEPEEVDNEVPTPNSMSVIINGIKDSPGSYELTAHDDAVFKVWYISSLAAYNEMIKYSALELRSDFTSIRMRFELPETTKFKGYLISTVELASAEDDVIISPSITLEIVPNLYEWEQLWSFIKYRVEFENALNHAGENGVEFQGYSHDRCGFVFRDINEREPIAVAIANVKSVLLKIEEAVYAVLFKGTRSVELVTTFEFPKETEAACKQYLIYFSQFLADLGIEADTEISKNINKTLFKVIPRSKKDSLLKIKQALEAYLTAPGAEAFGSEATQQTTDISVQQWHSNVLHLQSQLMLARATSAAYQAALEAKDERIKYLELTLFQVKSSPSPTAADKPEELIEGVMSISKFSKFGVTLNWAELFRKMKRRF